jgi:hypothetical protein
MKSSRIATLSLLALALLVITSSAFAQTRSTANVPFAFTIGNRALPAGSYDLSPIAPKVILIRSNESGVGVIALVRTEYAGKDQGPKLVFHKCGNQYFLAQIWDGSGRAGMEVPESNREKELRKESLASNHAGGAEETVTVALNQ